MYSRLLMKNGLCFIFLTFFFFQSACQKYSSGNLPDTQIHFGEGGGITGAITEYCLLKNGQLFDKKHFTQDFKTYKKVKKRIAKKSFKKCRKMNIQDIELNNPGDKYYFINYQTDKINHKITWGRNKEEVPAEVKALYTELKALIME